MLGIGVLGAFTTFSTFATEIALLVRDGHGATAIAYAVVSLLGSLAAVLTGLWVAGWRHAPGPGRGRIVIVLGVALAGALGAPARFAVEQAVRRIRPMSFPLGTFVVNVSGSFGLGVVAGLAIAHGLDPDLRTVVGTGFLGAYTTFSTYAYETVRRAEERERRTALRYAVGSIVVAGLDQRRGPRARGWTLTITSRAPEPRRRQCRHRGRPVGRLPRFERLRAEALCTNAVREVVHDADGCVAQPQLARDDALGRNRHPHDVGEGRHEADLRRGLEPRARRLPVHARLRDIPPRCTGPRVDHRRTPVRVEPRHAVTALVVEGRTALVERDEVARRDHGTGPEVWRGGSRPNRSPGLGHSRALAALRRFATWSMRCGGR